MLDTVHCLLSDTVPPAQMRAASKGLSEQSEHLSNDTGTHSITGNLGNLRVRVTDRSCSIQGSFSKFHLGDNIQTLTRKGFQEASEKLEDELHLPLSSATVRRLDIGDNLRVQNNPAAYFNSLLNTPYFDRIERSHSLTYSNRQRAMTFYDKLIEAKTSREELPFLGSSHHLLRYELRLLKNPAARLGLQQLTVGCLYTETVYMGLVDLWISHYQCIPKADNSRELGNILKNTRSLQHWLISRGIDAAGGKQALLNMIRTANTGKVEISRMKKFIRDFEQDKPEQAVFLSEELNNLIQNRSVHYR